MLKPPKKFCIDTFEYSEVVGENGWGESIFAEEQMIEHCRIDRGNEYSSTQSGRQLLFRGLIFCYSGITTPLPAFKEGSKVIYDDTEHIITKSIPIYEPYSETIYSYELEVV